MKFLIFFLLSFSLHAEVITENFSVHHDDCLNQQISLVRFGVCKVQLRSTSEFEKLISGPHFQTQLPAPYDDIYEIKFEGTKYGYQVSCQKWLNDQVGKIDCRKNEFADAMAKFLKKFSQFKEIIVYIERLET